VTITYSVILALIFLSAVLLGYEQKRPRPTRETGPTYTTGCNRCLVALEDDPFLKPWQNRMRGWLWHVAHRLNCEPPPPAGEFERLVSSVQFVELCQCSHNEYDHEHGPCEECNCPEWVTA
jgi:hypothetical protein